MHSSRDSKSNASLSNFLPLRIFKTCCEPRRGKVTWRKIPRTPLQCALDNRNAHLLQHGFAWKATFPATNAGVLRVLVDAQPMRAVGEPEHLHAHPQHNVKPRCDVEHNRRTPATHVEHHTALAFLKWGAFALVFYTSKQLLLAHHFAENAPQRPQINGFGVVFGTQQKLWGAVPKGNHHPLDVSQRPHRLLEDACEAKVCCQWGRGGV